MFVRPCYVDLDLRRLYYYGEDTKGALRNGTLYVLRHGPMLDPIYYCDIRRAWVSRKDPNFYIPWSAETFEEREQTFASPEHFWNWYTAKKVPI
jgi:hypothetical protein